MEVESEMNGRMVALIQVAAVEMTLSHRRGRAREMVQTTEMAFAEQDIRQDAVRNEEKMRAKPERIFEGCRYDGESAVEKSRQQ